jgi:hypothetical protein
MEISNPIVTIKSEIIANYSVLEYSKLQGFVQTNPTVGQSTDNKVPFVTFINSLNEATNLFFTKTISKDFPKGMEIKRGFFDDLQILHMRYDNGQERIKLAKKGGNRLDLMGLL